MKDDLANEDLAHLRALTEPKDDMLKRETPLPKASPVCPVCGLDRPHGHGQAELVSVIRESKNYATTLAVSMHQQHYAEDAPNWQPLPDLVGLLTQIDNMYAGLRNDLAAAQAERDTALTDTHDRIADLEAEVKDRIAELQRTYEVIRSHAQLTFKAEDERDEARAEAAALRVRIEELERPQPNGQARKEGV